MSEKNTLFLSSAMRRPLKPHLKKNARIIMILGEVRNWTTRSTLIVRSERTGNVRIAINLKNNPTYSRSPESYFFRTAITTSYTGISQETGGDGAALCRPRFFCSPLTRHCSLIHSSPLNPKPEPLTQRAAHGGRYTVQRGRSASESTKGGIR